MKAKQAPSLRWYNRRAAAVAQVLVGLILIYPLSLRAIDTGSLGQYSLVFLLFLAILTGVGYIIQPNTKGATITLAAVTAKKKKGHGQG